MTQFAVELMIALGKLVVVGNIVAEMAMIVLEGPSDCIENIVAGELGHEDEICSF